MKKLFWLWKYRMKNQIYIKIVKSVVKPYSKKSSKFEISNNKDSILYNNFSSKQTNNEKILIKKIILILTILLYLILFISFNIHSSTSFLIYNIHFKCNFIRTWFYIIIIFLLKHMESLKSTLFFSPSPFNELHFSTQ